MSEELIKRLRRRANAIDTHFPTFAGLLREAADTLAALRAQLAERDEEYAALLIERNESSRKWRETITCSMRSPPMSDNEILQQEYAAMIKAERHRNLQETRYWCDQYKAFAKRLVDAACPALSQPSKEIPK